MIISFTAFLWMYVIIYSHSFSSLLSSLNLLPVTCWSAFSLQIFLPSNWTFVSLEFHHLLPNLRSLASHFMVYLYIHHTHLQMHVHTHTDTTCAYTYMCYMHMYTYVSTLDSIWEKIWCFFVWEWLFLGNTIIFSSICCYVKDMVSFFFMDEWNLIVYMCCIFFIHSSALFIHLLTDI